MRIAIGIDPGVHTGIGIWNCDDQKWFTLATYHNKFFKAYEYIKELSKSHEIVLVRIEDPSQNTALFPKRRKAIRFANKNAGARQIENMLMKAAFDNGGNSREGKLWENACKYLDIPLQLVKPDQNSQTKWSADKFNYFTKYEGRSSGHARDAAMLVFQWR